MSLGRSQLARQEGYLDEQQATLGEAKPASSLDTPYVKLRHYPRLARRTILVRRQLGNRLGSGPGSWDGQYGSQEEP
jgi:hypothetical protein